MILATSKGSFTLIQSVSLHQLPYQTKQLTVQLVTCSVSHMLSDWCMLIANAGIQVEHTVMLLYTFLNYPVHNMMECCGRK